MGRSKNGMYLLLNDMCHQMEHYTPRPSGDLVSSSKPGVVKGDGDLVVVTARGLAYLVRAGWVNSAERTDGDSSGSSC